MPQGSLTLSDFEVPIHPTYGTLDNFLASIKDDILSGYYIRIGQIGAMAWYAEAYGKIRATLDVGD